MTFLPKAEFHPVVNKAMHRVENRLQRHITFLVGASDVRTVRAAATHAFDRLIDSGRFRDLRLKHGQDVAGHAIAFYSPVRFQLLSNAARDQLRAGNLMAFERAVIKRYYTPITMINSRLMDRDPLLLMPRFLEDRMAAVRHRSNIEDGYLTIRENGKIYIVLIGELAVSPFSITLQQNLMPLVGSIRTQLPKLFSGAEFLLAGFLPHAAAGYESAYDEITTVGLGSVLGIVVLFIMIFRSIRPLFLTLISIALGCLGGFAACLAIFGKVHLLTLLFGASLVGISVDYSLHYFCERFRLATDWSTASALRHIFPGITLGLLTTVMGFVGLFIAPFPGLQGMAVFSSVGLCIAYGCVCLCYPLFTNTLNHPTFEKPLGWVRAYGAIWCRKLDWRVGLAAVVVVIMAILGCLRLVASDDIRLFQMLDAKVMAEEQSIHALMGGNLASQYFLVEGADEADYLAREEYLTEKLRALQKNGQLVGYSAISDFIASPKRQKENYELLKPLIVGKQSALGSIARRIGLPDSTREAYIAAFLDHAHDNPIGLQRWLQHPVSEPYRHFWLGATTRGVIGFVGLRGVYDLAPLRVLADAEPSLHFVDPAGTISNLFGQYRHQTIWLTLISYGVVLLVLLARYGISGGLLVIAPPFIAAIASLSVLGILGEPISLFNVMALVLVLGIGVDYALFFRETGVNNPATLLAIALSCLTTLLAFGLMALSATPAIHAFGLTILVGILVAFLLSPMAGWRGSVTQQTSARAEEHKQR
jgi:predicted exporter